MRRTDAQQGFSSAAADADVIVVGCGLAGLSAALAAAQRRARVVLFDSSSDLFATNDVTDRLYFNAVDPERQGDLGITDSPELFYRQTLAAGGGRADPALVKILCYQAYIALKWLEGFGVGFENKVRQIPGGVYPRTCVASDYRAGRLAMMNAALDAGVTVLQGLTFRELVLDAQGRVTGVSAEDADGRRRILRAPATVLATGGFDGLVHLSDLSWNESGEEAVRKYKKGDELEAVVLAIDTERERISLGIKQMGGDPFSNFASTHDKNTLVKGTVKSVDAKGAVIDLGNDVEGYLRAAEISADRVEDATTRLAAGDEVEALITNIDRKNRSIQLSIRAKDAAEARDALDRLNADATAASGTTNLGALLKAKLEQR